MAKNTTLNNSAAYGFSANVARPLIIKVLQNSVPGCKVEAKAANSDKFKPIVIKTNFSKTPQELSVVIYYAGREYIALSLFNMMYAKAITFIANDNVYVVEGDTLRGNWQSIMARMRRYTDGSNISSEMTYADINKVIALASHTFPVECAGDAYAKYKVELQKLVDSTGK